MSGCGQAAKLPGLEPGDRRFESSRPDHFSGKSFGSACNRLLKALLFHMAQELKRDKCYRCDHIITSVDQFSIDHKTAWRSAPELFFDLNNIAFSHRSCNSRAARRSKIYPNTTIRKQSEWARYYAKKSEQILERKRQRYHQDFLP
jgi:hypothetical protein